MTITIETLTKKKNDMLAELREHGATALKAEFKKFFDANPECVALKWKQYTPYFNDGDACTFSVHDILVKMTDTPEDAGDDEDGYDYPWGDEWKGERAKTADGVSALGKIDDEIYQIAFGDHVEVTATREGFEVDEYSHD